MVAFRSIHIFKKYATIIRFQLMSTGFQCNFQTIDGISPKLKNFSISRFWKNFRLCFTLFESGVIAVHKEQLLPDEVNSFLYGIWNESLDGYLNNICNLLADNWGTCRGESLSSSGEKSAGEMRGEKKVPGKFSDIFCDRLQ